LDASSDRRVGLIYDDRMCGHYNCDDPYHPERPQRISAIWEKFASSGLTERCVVLKAEDVEDGHLGLVHTQDHINLIKKISSKKPQARERISMNFSSIYFNEGSSEAASLAAGSVVKVLEKVAEGELDSAFAVVRPPGHHAEEDEPMGFCLYNNVAVATSYLLNNRSELGISKILIVDWDVHHGNGTQKAFYDDPRVLFFSVHRHDFGAFYPGGEDGSYEMIGNGPGAGYNINVPWEGPGRGDADYLAVWDHVLIPVAEKFNPDMIVISAGFDSAMGDPLGECCLTPSGYSILLRKLMKFAEGKIVLALEGGYNLNSISNSAQACVEVLLRGETLGEEPSKIRPLESTWRVINTVRKALCQYWPVLGVNLDEEAMDGSYEVTDVDDVIKPLGSLKLVEAAEEGDDTSSSWRSELSKNSVWYASYGSNMNASRFRCYIEGGQVEGMRRPCVGSRDKTMPKEIIWKTFPHRLFFAREYTATWGPGGVAFLHPRSNAAEKTYMCLYKITMEQFNDVLHQENRSDPDASDPSFDLAALRKIQAEKQMPVESLEGGWYRNVVWLGEEEHVPILTMTCTVADVDDCISGRVPINPPGKEYGGTLTKALVEGRRLSEGEAAVYLEEASKKPL
ncbi:hypothetical protein M569_09656, partial [Genlisea aurea]